QRGLHGGDLVQRGTEVRARWRGGPATWCRSAAAASAGRSRWRTPACRASRTSPPRCGRRSSTSARAKPHRSIATRRARSGSWSKAKACGRSSTAIRCGCPAVICCLPRAGTSTATTTTPTTRMAWIDGLDIPLVHYLDAGFFEFGSNRVTDDATPNLSRAERAWCHPGLRPVSQLRGTVASPVTAYRWEHTDAALTQQLLLEEEGDPATVDR